MADLIENNHLNELFLEEDREDEFMGSTENDLIAEEGDEAGEIKEEVAEDSPVWEEGPLLEDGDREPELHQFILRNGINVIA